MKREIAFALPDIGEEEIHEVIDCLRSGWITTGRRAQQFEEDFKNYLGVPYALAVNSATAGLHLALDAIGLTRGDKVIVPTYTFTSSAEVVRYFDAEPIFCDSEPVTLCMDPSVLETLLIRHRPKAIMPVHFAGQACDLHPILSLARQYNCKVIEDAAHALPTTYQGQMVGHHGDIVVYSFYATKTITTAEGGMIVTRNPDYAKRMKVMRLHGLDRDAWNRYSDTHASWYYEIIEPGFKYNLTDIAASLGIHQLKKCDRFARRRQQIANYYTEQLESITSIQLPMLRNPEDCHAWHLYVIRVPAQVRDNIITRLKERGIGCSVHFIPLHLHPYWRDRYAHQPNDFPVAFANSQRAISLPIYTRMTDDEVAYVVENLRAILTECC